MSDLGGSAAIVTGASRGLGLAIARELVRGGASVACMARAGAELDGAVEELNAIRTRAALAAPADVTDAAAVDRAVAAAVERFGGLDIVVLNAGTWRGAPIVETSEEMWDALLDLNLKGAFLALRATAPHLIRRGRGTVIGIASLGAWVGQHNGAAYAASKWGLRGLLESAALELKPHRVRVSIVAPHIIHSSGPAAAAGTPERDRAIEAEDVASLVGWICRAPDYVSVGNVSIWPIGAGVVDM
jgi:NAD(P)-dependent dehydrogenase (short-subunit alcohol dehydrogenase family)